MNFEGFEERNHRLGRRSLRYALLSLMLTMVVVFSTGCTALLIGNDRKAYNLLVEASDYFKYPSSVRIESGKMYGSGLYCVIAAKNGFGNYRTDTYYVSESGYPLEDYDSKCYSDSLNCDLINSALAAHFGSGGSNVFGKMMGGSNMSTGGTVLIWILALVIYFCLNGLLASNASNIAEEKGYEKQKWFHMCFWLGPLSYIIIAAMPDCKMREKQDETNRLLKQMIGAASSGTAQAQQKDEPYQLPRL